MAARQRNNMEIVGHERGGDHRDPKIQRQFRYTLIIIKKTDYSNAFYCSFEITSVRGGLFERIASGWVSANEWVRK